MPILIDFSKEVESIIAELDNTTGNNGLLTTTSLFKLSTGSNKLRPYFKQFDENGVFYRVIRHLLLPNSAYKISLYKNNKGEYAAFWLIGFDYISDFDANPSKSFIKQDFEKTKRLHQQIFYGAPGTGKSHKVKETTELQPKENVFRTTFHPDSDYSTFVGCYKPTMKRSTITKDGITTTEEKIVYKFEPQAFTNAYLKAWQTNAPIFLVIEEINRGNCAQIFGDLFQLLDRKDGVSEYPVDADTSLAEFLHSELTKAKRSDIPEEVMSGKKLILPSNLFIWATMNTSDQSLFPIDSAFKRRWDWKYLPIENAEKGWTIRVNGHEYDWYEFELPKTVTIQVNFSHDKVNSSSNCWIGRTSSRT